MTDRDKEIYKRNEENFKAVKEMIDNNRLRMIIASPEIYCYLMEHESAEMKWGILFFYGKKVIQHMYLPAGQVCFVKIEDEIKFELPCVGGIWGDQPHP